MKHHVTWTHLPPPPLAVLLIPIPIPSAAAAPAPTSPAALGDYWLRDIPPDSFLRSPLLLLRLLLLAAAITGLVDAVPVSPR